MDLDKAIDSRHSVRDFSTKKVKWEKVIEAIDAAGKAPQAGNIHNMTYIIIEKQETRNYLAKHAQQNWIADAGIVIVVCSEDRNLESLYNDRGKIYARQQAGAAIQNLLLKITDLGLSACWVGAYHEEMIKQMLKIPGHITVEAIIPIGYPSTKPRKVKKTELQNLIRWETFGQSKKPTPFKDQPTW